MLRLSKVAATAGYPVSHTLLSQIRRSVYPVKRADRDLIQALACIAGVRYEVARDAAGLGFELPPFADELPAEADHLTREQRDAVLSIIRAFLTLGDGAAPVAE
ncbi:MAG TPA: hypothetical protein VFE65_02005 [Pseudonocardia sp.]|jgi:hypothetical protein|nr:hypothetical protein [Pseudonocardia sp.]